MPLAQVTARVPEQVCVQWVTYATLGTVQSAGLAQCYCSQLASRFARSVATLGQAENTSIRKNEARFGVQRVCPRGTARLRRSSRAGFALHKHACACNRWIHIMNKRTGSNIHHIKTKSLSYSCCRFAAAVGSTALEQCISDFLC